MGGSCGVGCRHPHSQHLAYALQSCWQHLQHGVDRVGGITGSCCLETSQYEVCVPCLTAVADVLAGKLDVLDLLRQ